MLIEPSKKLITFSTDVENDHWPGIGDDYYFDEYEANRWIWFIETHGTHVEGPLTEQPIVLFPFWRRVISEVFGIKRKKDGLRRFINVFIRIPRKNFKSGIISIVELGISAMDRPGTRKQNYILAATEDQAKRTFKMCMQQIEQNERLGRMFEATKEGIQHRETGSVLVALSSAPVGKVGSIPHSILWEEWQEQTSDDLVAAMETGILSGLDPLIIRIGTAGSNPSADLPGHREYLNAKAILEGKMRLDSTYVVIAEAPEDCDPGDRKIWAAVNPGFGYSVNERILEEIYTKAKNSADTKLMKKFKQYVLNIEQKPSSLFVSAGKWEQCYEDYAEADLLGRDCYGGLDIGGSEDMSAFYLLFPFWTWDEEIDEETGKLIKVPHADLKQLVWYWTPRGTVKNPDDEKDPYLTWERQGLLEITEGDTVDRPLIRRRIKALSRRFKILSVGYDRHRAEEMAQTLQDKHQLKMIDVAQQILTLAEPTALFKELVQNQQIRHNGHGVFDWNLQCARTIENTHEDEMVSSKFSKGDDRRGKVDGVSAAMNAWKLFVSAPPPKPKGARILLV